MTSRPIVTVIDYGAGNILSVTKAVEHAGARAIVTDRPSVVDKADYLILPGVGAFARAMGELSKRKLVEPIVDFAKSGRPFLGICLGMQLLLEESIEFGRHEGLGLIPGKVEIIPATTAHGKPHKIPHIGWNGLQEPTPNRWNGTLLENLDRGFAMYFVHSYNANPDNAEHVLATSNYHDRIITAAIQRDNLSGFQCHPEKSGAEGLQVLIAFVRKIPQ